MHDLEKSHAANHLNFYPDVNTKNPFLYKTCARKNGNFSTECDVRPFPSFYEEIGRWVKNRTRNWSSCVTVDISETQF